MDTDSRRAVAFTGSAAYVALVSIAGSLPVMLFAVAAGAAQPNQLY